MVLSLPLPALAQSSDSTFAESIDVRVVNVEAVVTDRNGVRIFGLTPEDFQLTVDGEDVPIEFFTEIRGGQVLRDVGSSAWDIAPISDGQASGTSYLVFVDDFFSIGIDRDRVLRALQDQLAFLGNEDRMAIVSWDGARPQMLTSWTSDVRKLSTALRRASTRPAEGLKRYAERRTLLAGSFSARPRFSVLSRQLEITERTYANLLIDQVTEAVDAAAATLRGFAAPPGRKVMLLVSGGWPFAPVDFITGTPLSARFENSLARGEQLYGPLIETANLLGYTLYPIDSPGLQTDSGISASSNQAFRASVGPRTLDFYRETELHYSLRYLARETGGRALINGQRQEPLSLVAEDTRSFYWMGFTPERTGDGEIREIRLEMRQPEFTIRSRSGFRDLSVAEEVTMQVESSLLFGNPAGSDQLAVVIGAGDRLNRKKMAVPLSLSLPASAVTLLQTGDHEYVADLEIRVAAIDARGNRSDVTTIPWRVTRGQLPKEDESIEFSTALEVRRQPQDLVVAVFDTKSGALFSASAKVDPIS
jgi:VWFA-related protein